MLTRRSFLAGAAAALAASPAAANTNFWGRRLATPPDFVFGYGSLMSTASRESTGRPGMHALPARLSPDFGYVRSWCARAHRLGFTALGLRPHRPGEEAWSINGVVFAVDSEMLPRFDRRESGYDRVAVPRAMIEGVSWESLPEGGTTWAYVPKGLSAPSARPLFPELKYPVLQSYVDLCLEGALEHGVEFAREVVATTADWDRFWLNDREIARRPWVATKQSSVIDDLLATTPPASAAFPDRLYSEDYAVRILRAQTQGTAQ